MRIASLLSVATLCLATESHVPASGTTPQQPPGFFITSVGTSGGGNLGWLAGADAHCA